jgi:hypothetical protein
MRQLGFHKSASFSTKANISSWRMEKNQVNNDEKEGITTNTNDIQRLIRDYIKNLVK